MSDLNPETLSSDDVRVLLRERDQLRAEVANLIGILHRSDDKVELLKEAVCQALEYIAGPNPYMDPARQRTRAILRMEDALVVNGCEVTRFEVRSDAN